MAKQGHREKLTRSLLAWYAREARDLPWRAKPGQAADPYGVWLSEIMLQQTTAAAVRGYYAKFLGLWPDISALAAAPLDDVLRAWAGLGYYARVRNLHACARKLAAERGGRFPETEEGLRALPGIGPYTAAAIAAIAFGQPHAAVDGNAERVISRLYAIETPLPAAKPEIRKLAQALVPEAHPGDFAQALMDLGATICTPRRPSCHLCPWTDDCAGRRKSLAETLPRKAVRRPVPTRKGVAFWIERGDGAVLLRRRPEKGLLGGMMEIPATPWTARAPRAIPKPPPRLPLPGAGYRAKSSTLSPISISNSRC
jgi:A/G-specific adenine glycosylase